MSGGAGGSSGGQDGVIGQRKRRIAVGGGGRPREGAGAPHRCSLCSLLFHPCRSIQICADGSLCPLRRLAPEESADV